MYTVVGKFSKKGVNGNGEPFDVYRIYCTTDNADSYGNVPTEGFFTRSFNCDPVLYSELQVGQTFQSAFGEPDRSGKVDFICFVK